MIRSFRRGGRISVVAAMAAVAVVGLAGPASAATRSNSSTGIVASGAVTAGPFAASKFPAGPRTDRTASARVAGLLSAGVINTAAGPTTASASVANLSVTLTPLARLSATDVSSQCSYIGTKLSGSATITRGAVTLPAGPSITLSAVPAANTTVVGLAGVATVVLNRQTFNRDGSLTVDAVFIRLLNGQTVAVASSTCQPAVLVISMIAPSMALAAGGPAVAGLLVFGFLLYRRQHPAIAQA